MDRMKTFRNYLLLFIAFYIFSTVAAYFYIKTTYEPMDGDVIESSNITVRVENAEATIVNGYIEGNITNSTDTSVKSKYIKFELISKRGNKILTKYVFVDELKAGESKDFKMNFRAENIRKFRIETVENMGNDSRNNQLINFEDLKDQEISPLAIAASVLILIRYFL